MKLLLTILIILIVAIYGNSIEQLTGKGYPSALIVVAAGTIALILSFIICLFTKKALLPTNWKFQGIRLLNNGIGALLLFESYKHLSAGTVSLVSRVDIPFLIMLSFFRGEGKAVCSSGFLCGRYVW